MHDVLDKELEQRILDLGAGTYSHLRLIDGKVCGLGEYVFTTGLMVGMSDEEWDAPCHHRYCYEHRQDALNALDAWGGSGDPPGPWVKRKGIDGEALGPGALT